MAKATENAVEIGTAFGMGTQVDKGVSDMRQATYYVAQYIPDPFRMEPKNVGVIVREEGKCAAQFFAEIEPCRIDKRRAKRKLHHPEIYEQWVEFWRGECSARSGSLDAILDDGVNYRVVSGGEVDEIEGALEEVTADLYSRLVSDEAEGVDRPTERLIKSIEKALLAQNTLLIRDGLALVPNPVRQRAPVAGRQTPDHRPSFVQENTNLYVAEVVECVSAKSEWAIRLRAGYTANMFEDIKALRRKPVKAITILNVNRDLESEDDVKYAMKVVEAASDDIIRWDVPSDRQRFLSERLEVANQTH